MAPPIPAFCSSMESVSNAAQTVSKAVGPDGVQGLVNNAGGW